MTTLSVPIRHAAVSQRLKETFVGSILPRIEAHGKVYFRHVRCRHRKQELIAEMAALSWRWFLRLVRRGKDALKFVSTLAVYAARAISSGRRVCGRERAHDAMSASTQRNRGFAVGSLPEVSTPLRGPLADALVDNTVSPVLDQVAFRIDFPAWRRTRSERDRRVIDRMMVGESTAILARLFGVSSARISQMRREFHDDWHSFCGELAPQAS
jgi:hypothetical protein